MTASEKLLKLYKKLNIQFNLNNEYSNKDFVAVSINKKPKY